MSLQFIHDSSADSLTAQIGRHKHPFDFCVFTMVHKCAASHRFAIDSGNQESHVRLLQRFDGQQMITFGRVEAI
jgi:hypothetical protein